MLHYIVIGLNARESFDIYNRLTDFKNQHTWGGVGGLPVGLLSVLSHYTTIECYIHVVFNLF